MDLQYTWFILVTENQKNVKLYLIRKNKQGHKIKATSLKQDKVNTLVSKLLATVTENRKEFKKSIHHKLKEYQNPTLFFYIVSLGLIVELFTTFSLILRGLNIFEMLNFMRIFVSCFDKVEWIFCTQFSIIFLSRLKFQTIFVSKL